MESENKYSRVIELEELKGYEDVRSIEIPCFTRETAIKEYGKKILVNGKEYFVKGIEKRGSFNWLKLVKADEEG